MTLLSKQVSFMPSFILGELPLKLISQSSISILLTGEDEFVLIHILVSLICCVNTFTNTGDGLLELAMVIDGVVGDFMPADSTSAANIANVFRYNEEDAQYIFNLSTAELETGIYILRITLDDGQQFTVQIEIR